MNRDRTVGLVLGLVLSLGCGQLPATATAADEAAVQPQPAAATTAITATADSQGVPLSPPAREVVKMAVSGVPDAVIQAYINNSGSTFNLTPEAIIHLQGIGVSGAITTTMLAHDKQLRDNAAAIPPATPAAPPYAPQTAPSEMPAPPTVQQPDYTDSAQAPPADPGYSSLAPYGYWNYIGGTGWCWQPYSWVWQYPYPWGLGCFSRGSWWFRPNFGWCWSPRARFGGFDHDFDRRFDGGFNRGFARFNGGFTRSATFFNGGTRGFSQNRSFGFASSRPFVIHNSAGFSQRSFGGGGFNRGFSGGGSGFGGMRSGGFSGGFSRGGSGFGGMGGGFHR
jgi:hypothetical protein